MGDTNIQGEFENEDTNEKGAKQARVMSFWTSS